MSVFEASYHRRIMRIESDHMPAGTNTSADAVYVVDAETGCPSPAVPEAVTANKPQLCVAESA